GDEPAIEQKERPSAPPPSPSTAAAPAAPATPAPAPTASAPAAPPTRTDGRVKASPIARRIAKDRGLDLGALAGSRPGGRIVKAEVDGVLAGRQPPVAVSPAKPTLGDAGSTAPPAAPSRPAGPTPGTSEKPETAKGQVQVIELTKLQQTVA